MKKFLNILASIILVIFLIIFELTLGFVYSVDNILDVNSISNTVQDIDLGALLYEDGELNDIGKEVDKVLKEMGLETEETEKLLNTPTLKKVTGNFIGSTTMSAIDPETEIIYPTKEDYINIIDECYDIIEEKENIDIDKEELKNLVDENYDELLKELKNLAKEISSDVKEG